MLALCIFQETVLMQLREVRLRKQINAGLLARKRRQFGETVTCEPSRFIEELPADDVQWQGGGEDTEGANEERGQETLDSLKSLFG